MAIDPFTIGLIVKGVSTLATTGMSIGQAATQKRLQAEAEREAAKAMAEARKRLDVNVYESLGIPMEVYELEREALLQQGKTAIQAGMEGEQRGVAATAGRVQLAQQKAQAGVRSKQAQELYTLDKMTAAEEGRLRDAGMQLDLAEAEGAQIASGQALQARQRAMANVAAGVTQMGDIAFDAAPLYGKTAAGRQTANLISQAERGGDTFEGLKSKMASKGVVNGVDFSQVAGMDRMQFEAFMEGVDPQFIKDFSVSEYGTRRNPVYNPFVAGIEMPTDPYMEGQTTIPNTGFDAFSPFN